MYKGQINVEALHRLILRKFISILHHSFKILPDDTVRILIPQGHPEYAYTDTGRKLLTDSRLGFCFKF